LTKTCSLPIRTSCETLAQSFLFFHSAADFSAKFRAKFSRALAKAHHQKHERRTANAGKVHCEFRRETSKENSADHTQKGRTALLNFCLERLTSAFFRGWRPISGRLFLSHSIVHCSGTEDISLPTTLGTELRPNKQQSISRKVQTSVQIFQYMPVGKLTAALSRFGTDLARLTSNIFNRQNVAIVPHPPGKRLPPSPTG